MFCPFMSQRDSYVECKDDCALVAKLNSGRHVCSLSAYANELAVKNALKFTFDDKVFRVKPVANDY